MSANLLDEIRALQIWRRKASERIREMLASDLADTILSDLDAEAWQELVSEKYGPKSEKKPLELKLVSEEGAA